MKSSKPDQIKLKTAENLRFEIVVVIKTMFRTTCAFSVGSVASGDEADFLV